MIVEIQVRLVVFDLDGTLVDSLGDLGDSMNAVLVSAGFPTHSRTRYRRFVGDGIVNLVRRSLPPEVVTDQRVAEFVDRMKTEYARRWLDSTRPYDGVVDLLRELHNRGVKTAVLSNKPDSATQTVVDQLFADHRFEVVRGARPDTPLKPDPTAALELVQECGVLPENCLYVGDTDTDMKTGRSAGMFTVGVTWGFRDAVELETAGAQRIIEAPGELLSMFLGGGADSL